MSGGRKQGASNIGQRLRGRVARACARIAQTRRGRRDTLTPDVPYALQIEVTSRCNLKCKMCPLTSGTSSSGLVAANMSDATWSKILPLAVQAKQVFVAGFGEPLTNRRCIELMRQLERHRVWMTLVTNGIAISPNVAIQLASLDYLIHINVSIDSPHADTYRTIRGGDLDRAVRGLRNLVNALGDGHRVSVSAIAMQENVATLDAFAPLLADIGVPSLVVQGLVEYNDYSEQVRLTSDETLSSHIDRLRRACDVNGIDLTLTIPDRTSSELDRPHEAETKYFSKPDATSSETRQCTLPWEFPFIDQAGRVFPCCYAASSNEAELGHVAQSDLAEIWRALPYENFRSALLDGRTMPSVCKSCTAAPLGPHPFLRYSAAPVTDSLRRPASRRVIVQFRNTGPQAWTAADMIRIGLTSPRLGVSPMEHPSWISSDRPCTYSERHVSPGEVGTFEFQIARTAATAPQAFQLVADGVCWLPGTRFVLNSSDFGSREELVR
jgi:radical SAM protein with 4Fe4S-binding SPASM domain